MFNNRLEQILPSSFLESSLLVSIDVDKSRGSAFLYVRNGKVFLITAKHVLFKNEDDFLYGDNLRVVCPQLGEDSRYDPDASTSFCIDLNDTMILKSKAFDIAAIYIGDVSEGPKGGTYKISYLTCVEFDNVLSEAPPVVDKSCVIGINKVLLSNDVFLLGYPTSLGLSRMPQFNIALPLLRKGIVASIDNRQRTIILDCFVFPGNSGAPVYQRSGKVTDEFSVIGVEFIPYVQEWFNPRDKLKNVEYQNSGYSVITSMDGVDQLIDDFDSVA